MLEQEITYAIAEIRRAIAAQGYAVPAKMAPLKPQVREGRWVIASPVAMQVAKVAGANPATIADGIAAHLRATGHFAEVYVENLYINCALDLSDIAAAHGARCACDGRGLRRERAEHRARDDRVRRTQHAQGSACRAPAQPRTRRGARADHARGGLHRDSRRIHRRYRPARHQVPLVLPRVSSRRGTGGLLRAWRMAWQLVY